MKYVIVAALALTLAACNKDDAEQKARDIADKVADKVVDFGDKAVNKVKKEADRVKELFKRAINAPFREDSPYKKDVKECAADALIQQEARDCVDRIRAKHNLPPLDWAALDRAGREGLRPPLPTQSPPAGDR